MGSKRKNRQKNFLPGLQNENIKVSELITQISSFGNRSKKNDFGERTAPIPTSDLKNFNSDFAGEHYSGTQANFKQSLEDEKFKSVYNEIHSRVSVLDQKIEGKVSEIESRVLAVVESKFTSQIKWLVGIGITFLAIVLGKDIYLSHDKDNTINERIEMKLDKRIIPIESKLNNLIKIDTLKKDTE